MNYEQIIIVVGLLAGIFLFKKTHPNYLKAILIGLIIVFILSFFEHQLLINFSFYGFGILTFIFLIDSGLKKKWLNLIIAGFAFISFLFSVMNFPYSNELKLLMIIPIFTYLLSFRNSEKYKPTLSITTILVAYELNEFLQMTTQWFD